ncbi:tRNA pseudouridine(55) synthase TruB [Fulvivirgaceae bacterium BMA12]|uniref:tRNA pseudouridine synthase B n=1 Tax=Agaribacillus aureus TaxID=3051825 RepID=A0ABT8LD17_9BACT|nr:tRNA pseudouridine(55) synthase TruB [Fulvivirgaceae bacterium BMA12]
MSKTTFDFNEGEVLLIDKPYQWTSFDVVKKLKFALKIKKIGHAGTLDPLATGLLIMCTGKLTKKIDGFQQQEKEYEGVLVLGKTTPSIDLETSFDSETDISHLTETDVIEATEKFKGEISQIPPQHSAIKVGGERVYKKARKGIPVQIKARNVEIKAFVITKIQFPEVHFKIICSKGTYIRSLVRDLGNELNTGAYLKALTRTRIGDYSLNNAFQLNDLIENFSKKQ